MQRINNHIMKTECPIGMKQTALKREYIKPSSYAKSLILTYAQFRLVLPCRLTCYFVTPHFTQFDASYPCIPALSAIYIIKDRLLSSLLLSVHEIV